MNIVQLRKIFIIDMCKFSIEARENLIAPVLIQNKKHFILGYARVDIYI